MFSSILKGLRKQKGVTQIQLAAAIGVSAGNVGDWETGESLPSYNALIALSKYFDVTADALLELETEESEVRILTEREERFLQLVRTLDHRDREELFDLAEFKVSRTNP